MNRVVLPAPFGPMSPVTVPACDGQVGVAQRGDAAEAHGDPLDGEDVGSGARARLVSAGGTETLPLERQAPSNVGTGGVWVDPPGADFTQGSRTCSASMPRMPLAARPMRMTPSPAKMPMLLGQI